MIKEAIEKLQELIEEAESARIVEVLDRKYSLVTLHPIMDPVPACLAVCTLTGIKDYLTANLDALDFKKIIIHVCGPEKVIIRSSVSGSFKQRIDCLEASPRLRKFQFGQYLPCENFIIGIQTAFVQDEITAAILKLAGNLSHEAVTNYNDDGITQRVVAKVGITKVCDVPVPSPVELRPFRTFLEVEQPKSKFILRIQGKEGSAPTCALLEADGGQWELDAIKNVSAWLQEKLPQLITILA
jgi:hypothetical protein